MGAIQSTYTATSLDIELPITVTVDYTDVFGNSELATSDVLAFTTSIRPLTSLIPTTTGMPVTMRMETVLSMPVLLRTVPVFFHGLATVVE